ncbi:hypothetical protein KKB17_06030 [bacterium]|nr:hypothetical protein [bacterium]MBU4562948.1 hypothetical protein [bacterium]
MKNYIQVAMIILIHTNDSPLIIIFEDVKKKLLGAVRVFRRSEFLRVVLHEIKRR